MRVITDSSAFTIVQGTSASHTTGISELYGGENTFLFVRKTTSNFSITVTELRIPLRVYLVSRAVLGVLYTIPQGRV